jgi:hypothetical protein
VIKTSERKLRSTEAAISEPFRNSFAAHPFLYSSQTNLETQGSFCLILAASSHPACKFQTLNPFSAAGGVCSDTDRRRTRPPVRSPRLPGPAPRPHGRRRRDPGADVIDDARASPEQAPAGQLAVERGRQPIPGEASTPPEAVKSASSALAPFLENENSGILRQSEVFTASRETHTIRKGLGGHAC